MSAVAFSLSGTIDHEAREGHEEGGGEKTISDYWDVCAANEPWCRHFPAESGLPLGALGPLAAQPSNRVG
jgi:hypothetical protein